MKRFLAIFLLVAVLFCSVSFPSFSASNNHQMLTHLNGSNFLRSTLDFRDYSDFDRLFDGDTSAVHLDDQNKGVPEPNGIFSASWLSSGDVKSIVIDLGAQYELSQINTYWGWAPEKNPVWNRWEFNPPTSYKIYVSDTEEGLYLVDPVIEVTDIADGDIGIADSVAEFSAVGRYVRIEAVCRAGYYALREVEFFGAEFPKITSLGASIRLEKGNTPAGLRFGARIDKSLLGNEGNSEYGFYLLPSYMLEAGETLVEYLKDGEGETLKVVARRILEQDESTITYTAVITNIPESAYSQEIVAVPYAVIDEETVYFDEMRKSFAGVAHTAIEHHSAEIGDEWYEALTLIAENHENLIEYYDVDAAAAKLGLDHINAVLPASLFVDVGAEYIGYKIDGSYKVDADTLYKLSETPCIGTGKIAWVNYHDSGSWSSGSEQPEFAPVDLLDDPIYMSMILPSERATYMSTRTSGAFLVGSDDRWTNIMTIGAIYKNQAVNLPDDAEFTLCISDINLAMRTTNSDGWFEAINVKIPTMYNQLYYLPWTLESTLGTYKISDRITYFDDHVEVKLYGRDLNATDAKSVSDEVQECVYHYWGRRYNFDCLGSEILGLVSSYKIWIKEPESSEYLVAAIGADWRDADGNIKQAFSGKNYAVSTTPVTLIGHTVPLSRYRDIMDSEKVQEILGID